MAVQDIREYPARPICGVGVVAFRDDRVLLIQRGKEPRRGEWSIPGGAVEIGESIREAAAREFREECGGDIELREVVEALDIISRDDDGRVKYHYIVIDFWAEWRGGEFAVNDEVVDARWANPKALEEFDLRPWTRQVIEKAVRMRADT